MTINDQTGDGSDQVAEALAEELQKLPENQKDRWQRMEHSKQRTADDFDYESHDQGYAQRPRADPRIVARVSQALGTARTVLSVGAGAYKPEDRYGWQLNPRLRLIVSNPSSDAAL
jgi:hypothetical protein